MLLRGGLENNFFNFTLNMIKFQEKTFICIRHLKKLFDS